MHCPECGAKNLSTSDFCDQCGASLELARENLQLQEQGTATPTAGGLPTVAAAAPTATRPPTVAAPTVSLLDDFPTPEQLHPRRSPRASRPATPHTPTPTEVRPTKTTGSSSGMTFGSIVIVIVLALCYYGGGKLGHLIHGAFAGRQTTQSSGGYTAPQASPQQAPTYVPRASSSPARTGGVSAPQGYGSSGPAPSAFGGGEQIPLSPPDNAAGSPQVSGDQGQGREQMKRSLLEEADDLENQASAVAVEADGKMGTMSNLSQDENDRRPEEYRKLKAKETSLRDQAKRKREQAAAL